MDKEYISVDEIKKFAPTFPDTKEGIATANGWGMAIKRVLSLGRKVIPVAHWVIEEGEYPYCSYCTSYIESEELTPFCPYCGAEMEMPGVPYKEDEWDKADRYYYEKIRDTERDPRFVR